VHRCCCYNQRWCLPLWRDASRYTCSNILQRSVKHHWLDNVCVYLHSVNMPSGWLSAAYHANSTSVQCIQHISKVQTVHQYSAYSTSVQCKQHISTVHTVHQYFNSSMAGWEMDVPFQPQNRLHQGEGLGWKFSSAKWRMANDTATSQRRCLFCSKWERIGKAFKLR